MRLLERDLQMAKFSDYINKWLDDKFPMCTCHVNSYECKKHLVQGLQKRTNELSRKVLLLEEQRATQAKQIQDMKAHVERLKKLVAEDLRIRYEQQNQPKKDSKASRVSGITDE